MSRKFPLKLSFLVVSFAAFVWAVEINPSATVARAQSGPSHPGATLESLGEALFNDHTLSTPTGMACVSCHSPETGFSHPISDDNQKMGPVPGAVKGRFGNRKPPSAAYAALLPTGIPHYVDAVQAYVGGLFYDGRAADTTAQAKAPFLNPNEMNNTIHNVGSPELVVAKVRFGPSGKLFREVYGDRVFQKPTATVYDLIAKAIAAYEASEKVSPFTSKYDAWRHGWVDLTDQELRGLQIATGTADGRPDGFPLRVNAHCADCHAISASTDPSPDLWTNSCYANLGVPKNPSNPYYTMTDAKKNPAGYNPFGKDYIDLGLGGFLYPYLGKPAGDLAENDPLAIDGAFKAPSLRNVDKRPYPGFVKSYMHNGVFKTLKDVVHFYNTRNLTTKPGEVIDFTLPDPYAGLQGTPLWAPPEWPSPISMINPMGTFSNEGGGSNEQIGNLHLTDSAEDDIVAFLQTLSDGYFKNPVLVRGTVTLGNYSGTVEGQPVNIEFWNGQTLVDSRNATLQADGTFEVTIVHPGTYDISLKGATWLRQMIGGQTIDATNGLRGLKFELANGDVDGNNEVNILDYGLLSNAFNTNIGDIYFLPQADLDGNGAVNIGDYAILSDNFNKSGD